MNRLFLAKNHILIETNKPYEKPELHRHSYSHLILSMDKDIKVILEDRTIFCSGLFIPSNEIHSVEIYNNPVLVFLFDSTTQITSEIREVSVLDEEIIEKILKLYENIDFENINRGYKEFLNRLATDLNIDLRDRVLDCRIRSVIDYIWENSLENIAISLVSNLVHLSESRFSHLFKEEVGVSFSNYLLNRKIYQAYKSIFSGESITDSALNAGFYSSSHFASTSLDKLGRSASSIRDEFKIYKIADN